MGWEGMQFGVQVNVYRVSWDAVRDSVMAMENGDWDSVWFADHYIPPGADREGEAQTAFEGLAAIATAAFRQPRIEPKMRIFPTTGGAGIPAK